jgi:HlyD family secretion protein
MKRLIRWLVILGVLGLVGSLVVGPGVAYWRERTKINYREAEVTSGKIVAVVNSTGTIKPVQSVSVGAFVSGPILKIYTDFNDEVKKDQLIAELDPTIYRAALARDQASLERSKADVDRAAALRDQARNNYRRALDLKDQNSKFISAQEMDQYKFTLASLEADLKVADTAVLLAKANLDKSKADVEYTKIRSPVSGIVIDRKIDPGQTVAASFQTPELFIVAPDLRKEVYVFASVDEADIGLITQAKEMDQPVNFTVDSWPDDLFQGKIFQIRMNATTTQNVVTYPVVVSTPNPDLKLKPSMTASLSFQIKTTGTVVRVPNAALRFYPQREQVREADRDILENKTPVTGETEEGSSTTRSADEKAEVRRKRHRRHVWVRDEDNLLRAVEVVIGISDNQYTELVSGELNAGDKLVTGVQVKR